MIRAPKGRTKVTKRAEDILVDITNYGQEKISLTSGRGRMKINKFDSNNDASNKCENERIFLNLLEFT